MNFYVKESKTHPDIKQFEAVYDKVDIKLFEYDPRFELYGEDFIRYDYTQPLSVDQKYFDYFDLIISDPPYLAAECHIKTGMTVKKVGKQEHKLIICTGNLI